MEPAKMVSRREGPVEGQASVACQDGCQDVSRPERSPAVGPMSVACVRLCATMDCGGYQQVRGVPREH